MNAYWIVLPFVLVCFGLVIGPPDRSHMQTLYIIALSLLLAAILFAAVIVTVGDFVHAQG